jgi:hypothetical protein
MFCSFVSKVCIVLFVSDDCLRIPQALECWVPFGLAQDAQRLAKKCW